MESVLKIEPAKRPRQSLSFELKKALQKRYNGCVHERLMNNSDISYLNGLLDAGIKDAAIVIDYIQKYDEIIIDEEF